MTSREFAIPTDLESTLGMKRCERGGTFKAKVRCVELQCRPMEMMVTFQVRAGSSVSGCDRPLIFFSQAPSCWWTRLGDLRDREPTSSYLSSKKMTPTALIFTTLYPARVILLPGYSMSTWRSITDLWGTLFGIYLETQTVHGTGQSWPSVLSGLTFIRYALYFSFPVLMHPLTSENINQFYISLIRDCIRSVGIFRPRWGKLMLVDRECIKALFLHYLEKWVKCTIQTCLFIYLFKKIKAAPCSRAGNAVCKDVLLSMLSSHIWPRETEHLMGEVKVSSSMSGSQESWAIRKWAVVEVSWWDAGPCSHPISNGKKMACRPSPCHGGAALWDVLLGPHCPPGVGT